MGKTKKSVDLNKLSFADLQKEVQELSERKDKVTTTPIGVWNVGKNYFIRTVTMYLLGKLVRVENDELVLEQCSWISDCGRFHMFAMGSPDNNLEVEPFPKDKQVIVGRHSIIDAFEWEHKLLSGQK